MFMVVAPGVVNMACLISNLSIDQCSKLIIHIPSKMSGHKQTGLLFTMTFWPGIRWKTFRLFHQIIRHSTPAAPKLICIQHWQIEFKILWGFRTTWYFPQGKLSYFSSVMNSYQCFLSNILSSKQCCWRHNCQNARPGDQCAEMVLLSSPLSIYQRTIRSSVKNINLF